MIEKYLSRPNQKLTDHCENVRNLCRGNDILKQCDFFHDIAKSSTNFQQYIRNTKLNKKHQSHAPASALIFLLKYSDLNKPLSEQKDVLFACNAIRSHHGKIKSFKDLEYFISDNGISNKGEEVRKQINEILSIAEIRSFFGILNTYEDLKLDKIESYLLDAKFNFTIEDYLLQKYYFSSLIFADKLDAISGIGHNDNDLKAKACQLFGEFQRDIQKYKDENNILRNTERDEARDKIINKYKENKGKKIYQITAPTGIGKTLISLELSMNIVQDERKERIIYCPAVYQHYRSNVDCF